MSVRDQLIEIKSDIAIRFRGTGTGKIGSIFLVQGAESKELFLRKGFESFFTDCQKKLLSLLPKAVSFLYEFTFSHIVHFSRNIWSIIIPELPFDDDIIEIVTPERVELSFPIAGLGSRFVAAMIDILLITALNLIVGVVLSFLLLGFIGEGGEYLASIGLSIQIIAHFLLTAGYYIYYEYKWNGQTPGKRKMKLRVMRYGGLPVDFASVLIRNMMRIIDLLLFAVAVGFLVFFLSKLSQRPGDYVAGTIVVKDRNVTLRDLDKYLKMSDSDQRDNNIPDKRFEKLVPEDAQLIELFLTRRGDMDPSQRREMAQQIGDGIRQKLRLKKDEYDSDESLILKAYQAIETKKDKW